MPMGVHLAPIPVLALQFAAWAVFLGGLAALQNQCNAAGTMAIVAGYNQPCSKIYRFFWFIMAWEFVVIIATLIMSASAKIGHSRLALLGLTTISTVLFIYASETLLEGIYSFSLAGAALSRMRCAAAGAIMVAAFNAIQLLVVGTTPAPVGTDRVDKNVTYATTAVPVGTTAVPVGHAAV